MPRSPRLPVDLGALGTRLRRARLRGLFASLVALMLLQPLLGAWTSVLGLAMVGLLLATLATVERAPVLALAAGLSVLHVGGVLAFNVSGPEALGALRVGQAAGAMLYGVVAARLLRHVLGKHQGTAEALYGAACVYLLVALAYAMLYAVVAHLVPGSFAEAAPPLTWDDLLYFSVVTLATVGYGDVTPVSPHARALVLSEVLAGVFLTTIVLARLVGLYHAPAPPDPPDA